MEPNLFNFATNELSQDAFFCWLISWSSESFKESHPNMYERSRAFLEKVLSPKIPISTLVIQTIKIKKQYKKIDFIVIINDSVVILFEDKIGTKNHSGQLKRYSDIVAKEFKNHTIIKIYLKSDYTWKAEERDVKKQGYKVINIKEIHSSLISHSKNDIYEDFIHSIQSKMNNFTAYKTKPKKEWFLSQWFGFYHALSESNKLNYVNFGKFHSGNTHWFIVSWKNNILNTSCHLSLEIFSKKLLVKAHINDESVNRREYRDKVTPLLLKEFGPDKCKISNRTAKIMTLLVIKNFPLFNKKTNLIEFDKSVEKLKSFVSIFENLADSISIKL